MIKLLVLAAMVVFLTACKPTTQTQTDTPEPVPSQTQESTHSAIEATLSATTKTSSELEADQVLLTTSQGDIILQLYPKDAPNTVDNFLSKAESGFYEGLTFHRVEDWVVQGGDPDGTGAGGGEMAAEYNKRAFAEGSLGIARGLDRKVNNDSQFFICTADCSWLTGDYTNFGEVVEGMEVVHALKIGDTITSITLSD